jgi:hypothetical protein
MASDHTPDWWFAFRMPAEYGPLSVLAIALTDKWWVLLVTGGATAWLAARVRGRESMKSERALER